MKDCSMCPYNFRMHSMSGKMETKFNEAEKSEVSELKPTGRTVICLKFSKKKNCAHLFRNIE